MYIIIMPEDKSFIYKTEAELNVIWANTPWSYDF